MPPRNVSRFPRARSRPLSVLAEPLMDGTAISAVVMYRDRAGVVRVTHYMGEDDAHPGDWEWALRHELDGAARYDRDPEPADGEEPGA